MVSGWLGVFLLQGSLMAVDEFYFHHKRGLEKWERVGHPLDTLTVLACYLFALLVPFSETALYTYVALAIFSCIFITKDEFVHAKHCPAGEHWLHAVLFVLHPILLGIVGWLWMQGTQRELLWIQLAVTGAFLLYQIVFWGFRETGR